MYFAIREKKLPDLLKSLGLLVVAVLLAAGTNFTHLNTTREYTEYTTRGGSNLSVDENEKGLDKTYATGWSIGISETLTLLIPNTWERERNYFDRDTSCTKHFRNTTEPSWQQFSASYKGRSAKHFVGICGCHLYSCSCSDSSLLRKGRWWLLAATILSILLAWGKNFMPLTSFSSIISPGYNKFRAVSTILVIAGFTIPLMPD